jgi:hypothetical protein
VPEGSKPFPALVFLNSIQKKVESALCTSRY